MECTGGVYSYQYGTDSVYSYQYGTDSVYSYQYGTDSVYSYQYGTDSVYSYQYGAVSVYSYQFGRVSVCVLSCIGGGSRLKVDQQIMTSLEEYIIHYPILSYSLRHYRV